MRRLMLLLLAAVLLSSFAAAQVTITTLSLPNGYTNNIFYSQNLTAALGPELSQINATLTWSISNGSLPPGLSLNPNTGAITGNPTTAGVYNFTVLVQVNFTGYMDQRQLALAINTPKVTIVTDAQLPNGALNNVYQLTLQATTDPALVVSWSLVGANTLPLGLGINSLGTISGTPQATGTFTFTVQALLANTGINDSKTFTLRIFNGQIQITSPAQLPTATVGQAYSYTLTSQPGNVTWAAPALPGITLDPNTGILSGIPTISGSYSFTISASAAGFAPASKAFSFYVITGPLAISNTSLPLAILAAPYSVHIGATGGIGPYLYRISGTAPPGLGIDLNTGVFSGTPTAVGQYTFVIEVTDATSTKVIQPITMFVAGPVTVITGSLPNGIVGAAYNQTLSAGGGQAPYTWSIASGTIPPGLQLSSFGTITGAPTRNGFFQFTVQVSDNGQRTATSVLSITVGGIGVFTATLPDAGFGVAYLQNLQVTGGIAPYTWSMIGGALPPGLTLNSAGALQGSASQTGTFQFTVQVTDATQSVAQRQLSINVVPALSLTTASLPGVGVGAAYSQTLSATGGTPPYTFAIELGSLPPGMSLSPSGTISGASSTQGSYTFGILLADSGIQQVHKSYTINVGNPILISVGNLGGTAGAAYSHTLTASGGDAPYTWGVLSGSLPPGLSLDASTGIISGTPAAAGSFPATINVADSKNVTAQQAITIAIALPALPAVTVSLSPDSAVPAQQPAVALAIGSPYLFDISGTLTLTFQSSFGGDDQTVRFSNGTRSAPFTIPAGSTQAQVVMAAGPSGGTVPVALLTGTVAGTITITARLQASGLDATPAPAPTKTVTLAPSAPVISSVSMQSSGSTVTVTVTGYSNTREMVSGLFHFTPATVSSDLTQQLSAPFASWYGSSASNATGGQFSFTTPFNLSPGAISSVTVTLTNTQGASNAVSSQ